MYPIRMKKLKFNRNVAFLLNPVCLAIIALAFFYWPQKAAHSSSSLVGTNGLTCNVLPELMRIFSQTHIADKAFPKASNFLFNQVHNTKLKASQQFIEKIKKEVIKNMDQSKSLLLTSDVAVVKKAINDFMDNLRKPDCNKLKIIIDIQRKRIKEQLAFVRKKLGKKYKFTDDVTIIVDSKKRIRPRTLKESEKYLTDRIHYQISSYLLNDMKLKKAKKKLIHRYELSLKRAQEYSHDDLYDMLLNSYAGALDPHSTYFSKHALEDFKISMSLSLEGIGASLSSEDGYTVIQELIAGGAAYRSNKLHAKDKILAVGQGKKGPLEDIVDMSLKNVVKKIRGKKGSIVRLRILRQGKETRSFVITLTRAKVNIESAATSLEFKETAYGKKKLKLAHLILPSFYYAQMGAQPRSSYKDMLKKIEIINKEGADGVLLDFSRNGGGLLLEAVRIAGLFIKEGNIVATKNSQRNISLLKDENPQTQYTGPLVILTSRVSASASEIVAGALKDYKRAVIVGDDHTYGKGSIQQVIPLEQIGGALKVTTGLFFIPGGHSTQHRGVTADIVLPSLYATDNMGEQYHENSLKPQRIDPFLSNTIIDKKRPWKPINNKTVALLRKYSKKRSINNPKFKEIKKDMAEIKKNKGVFKLSELRKKSKNNLAKNAKDKDKTTKQLIKEQKEPQVNEALKILIDLIAIENGWVNQKITFLPQKNK